MTPYTPDEAKAVAHIIHEAALAEEQFGLDELERFALQRQPAQAKPAVTFDNNLPKPRQGKLFAGSDCLPNQQELFNPNGPKEK